MCVKVLFRYCMLYGPSIIYVYITLNSFCLIFTIFWKHTCLWFHHFVFILLHLSVFMTYSTSYCCYYKLMDPLYMFVCVCVHSYVYMYTLCFQRECLEKYMDTALMVRVSPEMHKVAFLLWVHGYTHRHCIPNEFWEICIHTELTVRVSRNIQILD
jgi:hypothetical protein